MISLAADDARLLIDEVHGGRLASLVVHGRELLVTAAPDRSPMEWGSYPMVPFAGRIRGGRFEFDGSPVSVPADFGGHAIHGYGYLSAWTADAVSDRRATISTTLGAPWPFGGTAAQTVELTDRSLACTLSVTAGPMAMPAQVGWHPWFAKPDALGFVAARMYRRDDAYIATAESVDVPPGPWDDCFTDVEQPVTLAWGDLTVELRSDCTDWVVYDQPQHATCVEPQSGPPDGFTLAPHRLAPGETLTRQFELRWLPPSG